MASVTLATVPYLGTVIPLPVQQRWYGVLLSALFADEYPVVRLKPTPTAPIELLDVQVHPAVIGSLLRYGCACGERCQGCNRKQ